MDIKALDKDFAVSPQIAVADIAAIKAQGYRAIIANRPDGEAAGQPPFAEIAAAAEAAGLAAVHVPVISGQITEADVIAFKAALAQVDGPVLAYCASGTRAGILWSRAHPDKISA